MDSQKLKESETEAFSQIKKIIDERVFAKMSKPGAQTANINDVEKECQAAVFNELKKTISEQFEVITPFARQLALDDINLFNSIKSKTNQTEILELMNSNKIEDLKNYPAVLSSDDLDAIYNLGYKWFQSNEYDKALLYFSYLSLLDGLNSSVWKMKGMTEYHLQKYYNALRSYVLAINYNPTDLISYIYIIYCLILTQQIEAAKQVYEDFSKEIDPDVYMDNSEIKEKLKLIKQFL